MANTTTVKGKFVTITGLDTKWVYSTDLVGSTDESIRIRSIRFNPSNDLDILIIHEHTTGGSQIFHAQADSTLAALVEYYPGIDGNGVEMKPVIDCTGSCTITSASSAAITFEIA